MYVAIIYIAAHLLNYAAVSYTHLGLHGGNIFFDVTTVGGTLNVILAAVKADGVTVIENAAREPHVDVYKRQLPEGTYL